MQVVKDTAQNQSAHILYHTFTSMTNLSTVAAVWLGTASHITAMHLDMLLYA